MVSMYGPGCPLLLFNSKARVPVAYNWNVPPSKRAPETCYVHPKLFANGTTQTMRIISWHSIDDAEIWGTGVLVQTWAPGRKFLQGTPLRAELWTMDEHLDPQTAQTAAHTLAVNNTYSTLKALLVSPRQPVVGTMAQMPFLMPGQGAVRNYRPS